MPDIASSLRRLRDEISSVALSCGRDPNEIRLLAVCKTFPPAAVEQAAATGHRMFGENRVQEAEVKIPGVGAPGLEWHLIGHLQSNKARRAVQLFDVIQSIDGERIAQAVGRHSTELQKVISVYLEVNIGDEPQKHGVVPAEVGRLASIVQSLPNLRLEGLMAIPPYSDEPEDSRKHFVSLRRRLEELNREIDVPVSGLSMGMSHDWRIAVEEGATLLRIGTAIFGSRGE